MLEPRSNTMKLGTMKAQLAASLREADQVFCYSRDLGWDVAAALSPLQSKAATFDDLETLITAVVHAAEQGDHLLLMSNGGFGGIRQKLLSALSR